MIRNEFKIIAIDDEEINVELIREFGKTLGLDITGFSDPIAALAYLIRNPVDMAIVDYLMPGINGIELISVIKKLSAEAFIVMITGVKDDEFLEINALEAGATDFLTKPLKGSQFKARLKNLMDLKISQILLNDRAKLLKSEVEKATHEIYSREIETLDVLGMAAEYKDPETATHIQRVAHYSRLMAEKLGENEESSQILYHSSPLHDIGKMGIPDRIILKNGPLTPEEWEIMKSHTVIGYRMIRNTSSKFLKAGAEIALSHHENFDGTGYPNSLVGKEIPLSGRIVSLADAFDALNTRRPYKEPWPFEKSAEFILDQRGKKFDPDIVDVFRDSMAQFRTIYDMLQEKE